MGTVGVKFVGDGWPGTFEGAEEMREDVRNLLVEMRGQVEAERLCHLQWAGYLRWRNQLAGFQSRLVSGRLLRKEGVWTHG